MNNQELVQSLVDFLVNHAPLVHAAERYAVEQLKGVVPEVELILQQDDHPQHDSVEAIFYGLTTEYTLGTLNEAASLLNQGIRQPTK